jgi:hypothetical protein
MKARQLRQCREVYSVLWRPVAGQKLDPFILFDHVVEDAKPEESAFALDNVFSTPTPVFISYLRCFRSARYPEADSVDWSKYHLPEPILLRPGTETFPRANPKTEPPRRHQRKGSWGKRLTYLQRLQKIDQILHLLRGKIYLKALVVEFHDLRQVGGGAIVKIRSACGKSAQN